MLLWGSLFPCIYPYFGQGQITNPETTSEFEAIKRYDGCFEVNTSSLYIPPPPTSVKVKY